MVAQQPTMVQTAEPAEKLKYDEQQRRHQYQEQLSQYNQHEQHIQRADSQQRQQLQQCLLVHLLHVAPPTGISKLLFQAGRQQGVKACWYDLTPVSTLLLLFLLLI